MKKKLPPILFVSAGILTIVTLFAQALDLSKDTDRDGIPDFLELVAGYDPKVHECLPEKCHVNLNGFLATDYFVIILDQSGSMAGDFHGQTRMEAAKKVIKGFVTKAGSSIKLGMFTYGRDECSALDPVHSPFDKDGKKKILEALPGIEPMGSTPIGASLAAFRELIQNKKGRFSVLLVTDGGESCNGNPLEEAQKLVDLNSTNLGINFYIAGLDLEPGLANEFKKIAESTKGKYYDITKPSDFENLFMTPMEDIIASYKGMVCLQAEVDSIIECENRRISRLNLTKLKKASSISSEMTEDEKKYVNKNFPKIEATIQKRLETYKQFKKEGTSKYQEKIEEATKLLPGSTVKGWAR